MREKWRILREFRIKLLTLLPTEYKTEGSRTAPISAFLIVCHSFEPRYSPLQIGEVTPAMRTPLKKKKKKTRVHFPGASLKNLCPFRGGIRRAELRPVRPGQA